MMLGGLEDVMDDRMMDSCWLGSMVMMVDVEEDEYHEDADDIG